jgi:hypothetical protein
MCTSGNINKTLQKSLKNKRLVEFYSTVGLTNHLVVLPAAPLVAFIAPPAEDVMLQVALPPAAPLLVLPCANAVCT